MKYFLKLFSISIFINIFVLAGNSYAYIDPGTLTAFLQLIIAGIVGALVTIKLWWYKFQNFLTKISKKIKKKENNN